MKTIVLYRPINKTELNLIKESGWKCFPSRLPEQPFFYPVLNEKYAIQITREWNVPAYGNGYVVRFEMDSNYLNQFKPQNVGGIIHNELWVPAEKLEEFNKHIIGPIKVIAEFES